jgi:AcrR family transcriptional regulator
MNVHSESVTPIGGTMVRTSPRSDSKREAVHSAALLLFTERGFAGTSVPMIAEHASVGVGTIYRYFESKETLVNSIYQTWKQRLMDALTSDFPPGAPGRAHFSLLWNRLAQFAQVHPIAFAFLEMHHHTPYLDPSNIALTTALTDFLRGFVAQSDRLKPLPPDLLIALVFGGFVGLFKSVRAGEISFTPEVLSAAEACCWDAIAA